MELKKQIKITYKKLSKSLTGAWKILDISFMEQKAL